MCKKLKVQGFLTEWMAECTVIPGNSTFESVGGVFNLVSVTNRDFFFVEDCLHNSMTWTQNSESSIFSWVITFHSFDVRPVKTWPRRLKFILSSTATKRWNKKWKRRNAHFTQLSKITYNPYFYSMREPNQYSGLSLSWGIWNVGNFVEAPFVFCAK